MQGCGAVADVDKTLPKVIPNAFIVQNQAIELLTLGKTNTRKEKSFGPEIGFALEMASTERPVYLIKYAMSGMPLHPGWSKGEWRGTQKIEPGVNFYPGVSAEDSNQGTLYKAMQAHFRSRASPS